MPTIVFVIAEIYPTHRHYAENQDHDEIISLSLVSTNLQTEKPLRQVFISSFPKPFIGGWELVWDT
jgi:hypothetical protein